MRGNMLEKAIRLLYPKHCLFCDEILTFANKGNFCEKCSLECQWLTKELCNHCGKPLEKNRADHCYDCSKLKHHFTAGRALWLYQEGVKNAIKRYKFEGRHSMHKAFTDELFHFYEEHIGWQIDLITSVPLHLDKLRKRGYNQAALISNRLGKLLQIRTNDSLLKRTKKTLAQKELADAERILNVKDAFVLNKQGSVEGLNILVVDDIFTTGATIDACSSVLKEAGAANVYFLTIAIGKGY